MTTHNILILGEAWGKNEEEQGRPFVGASGHLLNQALSLNGIDRSECFLTNVFNFRPPGNDIKALCGEYSGTRFVGYRQPQAIPGFPKHSDGWVHARYAPELARLDAEIKAVRPNLIIALGGTATWFLLHDSRISKLRGSTVMSRYGKVLPAYHPAAVLREYSLRPLLFRDLEKAAREQHFPEVRRPQRFVHIEPSWEDIQSFYRQYIVPSPTLSVDVETIGSQITCIGFAPSHDRSLVIPFYDPSRTGGNYWPSVEMEVRVWRWIARTLREPRAVIGQNFLYDLRFLWRFYGIPTRGYDQGDDTMLMHHSLQPEMQKGLGFLGSIYTDEAAWKLERRTETVKKED